MLTLDSAKVECARCGRPLVVSHERLRQLADADTPAMCPPDQPCNRPRTSRVMPKPGTAARTFLDAMLPGKEYRIVELVLLAFDACPRAYALDGYPHYPDSHRVLGEVAHLKRRKLIERVRTGVYRRAA